MISAKHSLAKKQKKLFEKKKKKSELEKKTAILLQEESQLDNLFLTVKEDLLKKDKDNLKEQKRLSDKTKRHKKP